MARMRIIGISNDVDHCECCGKQGLKRTIVLSDDGGETFKFYGVVCAQNALKAPWLTKANMERAGLTYESLKYKSRIAERATNLKAAA